jgi:predicted nuclease of predicted toxin-antitoxin system
VKLLFDHNLSPALANHLQDLAQVPDTEVWEYAQREKFLIVTKDSDFSDLSLLRGFPPKIIWIRRGNCKTSDIEAILRNHHSDIEALNNNETAGVLTLY